MFINYLYNFILLQATNLQKKINIRLFSQKRMHDGAKVCSISFFVTFNGYKFYFNIKNI